ncbi:MAG: serpin family protein, partial [Clostridia bacterium]|nr:serpin family protein [Clostridia bacterium]
MFKKIIAIIMVLAFSLALFSGCGKDGGEGINRPTVKADTIGDEVVEANSNFAFDILKAVYESDTEGNVFLSPASISMALAMTWNGADGNTRDEMAKVLGFSGVNDMLVNG